MPEFYFFMFHTWIKWKEHAPVYRTRCTGNHELVICGIGLPYPNRPGGSKCVEANTYLLEEYQIEDLGR